MKKSLPFLFLFALAANAQNIDDNKVNFGYIQLPSNPIDKKYTTYDVAVNKLFDQANTDSLNMYQYWLDAKIAAYDAQIAGWKEQKKLIDRNYLTQMAAWQKANNAGTVAAQPVKQPYPAQPESPEEEMPLTHEDFSNDVIVNGVTLQGFQKGQGGAVITIDVNPIKNFNVVQTIKGEGAARKYNYTCNYEMPVGLKVESASQGVVLQTILLTGLQSYALAEYASQYEYELWLMDNRAQMWKNVQTAARQKIAAAVSTEINEKCGFPSKTRATEVYTIKKFKDHSYADLTKAYQAAQAGYLKVGANKDCSAALPKMNEAIGIWEKALGESNLSDNNARINDKVTAMLYTNLAEAYLWINNFQKSEYYMNLAINADVFKFKNHAQGLQSLLAERRMRFNTNQ